MPSSYPEPITKPSWELLGRSFAYRAGARFTGLLSPDFFGRTARRHRLAFGGGRGDTFDAPLSLWAWVSQALSSAKSCLAGVARVLVLCASLGRPIPSAGTGAYCKARAKLPTAFLSDLTVELGALVEAAAPAPWRWRGHAVKVADGTLLQLPDTDANLEDYPQQRPQKPGTGYTCLRLVVLLGLATGALLGAADGPYRGKGAGELSLLARLLAALEAGDVLVADAAYCGYALLGLLRARSAHGCVRLHTGRHAPAREDDCRQAWVKPKRRPDWLDEADWAALPAELTVRLLRVAVRRRGFRPKEVLLATTLLEADVYPKEEVAGLYLDRWNGERDIRALKQGLGLKMLRCQTPERVRAELGAHLLTYNLLRCAMAQAAHDRGHRPRQLSFTGAARTLDEFRWLLCCGGQGEGLGQVLAVALATHRVGDRPGRYEPRELKRRPRKYPELTKARRQRREELATPGEDKGGGKRRDRPGGR